MKTYLILISGQVQGVGFRYTTCNLANHLQVTGTVENLSNGQVKIIVQGPISDLKKFSKQLQQFPNPNAKITKIQRTLINSDQVFSNFKVKF
ncbi:acylphosphatase [Fructilactobacillus frigidiflavus]|uniref:acylphosphatase n=1 Tax=Fructilactobacillus frigidiflavus TaxID=3242688 RepID=UPI003757E432